MSDDGRIRRGITADRDGVSDRGAAGRRRVALAELREAAARHRTDIATPVAMEESR